MKEYPVDLDVDNKLVISWHFYSWEFDVDSYKEYGKFKKHLDEQIGFFSEEGQPYTAPLWLGEFGTNENEKYWLYVMNYLREKEMSFAYWAYNGY